jgi:hypothetical protein
MKILIGVVGVIAALLGGLWLLQGVGAVHVRPILCVADCAAIQGRSTTWAVIGAIVAAAGVLTIVYAFRRRGGPRT